MVLGLQITLSLFGKIPLHQHASKCFSVHEFKEKNVCVKMKLTVTKPTPADFTICNTNDPVAFPLFNSSP